MNQPERRFVLDLKVQGDSVKDIVIYLNNFIYQLEIGEISDGCSGGVSSGSVYKLRENPEMTHEKYFQEIKEFRRW